MVEIYANAPLDEVVFEIRFSAELRINEERSRIYEIVRGDFPRIEVPASSPGDFPALKPFKFSSKDGNRIIQISMNRFSYHEKKYKGGFVEFEKSCLGLLPKFLELFGIASLKRTGLRYINHIPFVRVKGIIPLAKYLNIKISLPGNAGREFEGLGVVLVSRLGEGKLRTVVETRSSGKEQKAEMILLDFDYFIEGSIAAGDVGKLLKMSHKHTKKVFLDFISKDYVPVMRGESK